jgi:hypothetical protein
MKKLIAFSILLTLTCNFQGKPTSFFDKQFNWKMEIPSGFIPMSNEQLLKYSNTGSKAISKTTGTDFKDQGQMICIFQKNAINTFSASYDTYDSTTDGSLSEICQHSMELIYTTYQTQLKGAKIDTSSSIEIIDSLAFNAFKIIMHGPNQRIVTMVFYERIFDDKIFSININYGDEKIGAEIIEAWKKSKFSRG